MTKASNYQPPFVSFGEQTIGAHTVKTGTTKAGATWYYHAGCATWFRAFESSHGGAATNAQTWLQHRCPTITPATLLCPHWLELANAVRAQSARLAAGK